MSNALTDALRRLDGRPYGAYKQVVGRSFSLTDAGSSTATFVLDRAQVDPYAPPSLAHVELPRDVLPPDLDALGRVAAADFLARRFRADRDLTVGPIGQQVVERTAVRIEDDRVLLRLAVALPAAGRRIKGRAAAELLGSRLPAAIAAMLEFPGADLAAAVALLRDQEHVRAQLRSRGLVAFVGDGSVLARRSGDSDLPLGGAVPSVSPQSLRVSFSLPSGGTVHGLGIPEGVTVIVGGGYHGKSTLLRALQLGVYPHVAGDGREWVITRGDAVTIRAEDARAVTGCEISAFISGLPGGQDTARFSTTNASGSTSQAANLVEALEAGSRLLLIDEDTSAANFMFRDERMYQLVPNETITPLVDRAPALRRDLGLSLLVVAGGSGGFLEVADTVLRLDEYRVEDVTDEAFEVEPNHRWAGEAFPALRGRSLMLHAADKRKPAQAKGRTTIRYGKAMIELGAADQLLDGQTAGVAHALDMLESLLETHPLPGALDALEELLDAHGPDALARGRRHPGLFVRPRRFEIAAAVNRYRGLRAR